MAFARQYAPRYWAQKCRSPPTAGSCTEALPVLLPFWVVAPWSLPGMKRSEWSSIRWTRTRSIGSWCVPCRKVLRRETWETGIGPWMSQRLPSRSRAGNSTGWTFLNSFGLPKRYTSTRWPTSIHCRNGVLAARPCWVTRHMPCTRSDPTAPRKRSSMRECWHTNSHRTQT